MGPGPGQATGADTELLERDGPLSVLSDLLAGVRADGSGRLVWVGGEAGVGKTALLRLFCEAQDRSVRVLWGACEPLRTPHPLGAVLEVADAVGGRLAHLLAAAPRPYEVAVALLEALPGATVLVLEDVHWADEATLDVLAALATRVRSTPTLVLASYRDDELDRSPQLRFLLGEFARGAARLKVQRLSPAAVAELAQTGGVDAGELYRTTDGNPFYVSEVLAAGAGRMPETVRDAVLARCARCSEPARRLLEAVAAVPGGAPLWLAEALAGEVGALEECMTSGMLVPGRAAVAFRHELARMAVEEATAPDRRRALHLGAIDALERRGGDEPDVAALAHHAEEAGEAQVVLRWAPRAAERAARSNAHREAAAQYARALRFADREPLERRAQLLARRAEECYLTAQIDDAIDAQRQALECHRRLGDRRGEGNALRFLSHLLFFAGRASAGEPLVREAIEVLEPLGPSAELAMAYSNLSQRRMVVFDLAGARAWGAQALELARSLGAVEAEISALGNIAAATFRSDPDAGRPLLEHGLELALRHGQEERAAAYFSRLTMFPVSQRRLDIADDFAEAGLEYCAERGLETWRLYLLACGAWLELERGRWTEAADAAGLVLRDPRSAHVAHTWALVALGLVRARRGDADWSAPLAAAQAMVAETFEIDRIAQSGAARGEAAWLAGDPGSVPQLTGAALALALDRKEPWALGELAYWRWQAGVEEDLPLELMAEPYRLAITGDWARAADCWQQIGCPYEAALALGSSDEGGALQEAVKQLQALGARPAATIVARRLRERGIRGVPRGPRQRTRANPAGLTARELDVLALVAEGLRNAQIAERLILSQKTVDHHVSAILRKLDARTRGEAAAEATRRRLLGPG